MGGSARLLRRKVIIPFWWFERDKLNRQPQFWGVPQFASSPSRQTEIWGFPEFCMTSRHATIDGSSKGMTLLGEAPCLLGFRANQKRTPWPFFFGSCFCLGVLIRDCMVRWVPLVWIGMPQGQNLFSKTSPRLWSHAQTPRAAGAGDSEHGSSELSSELAFGA